MIQSNNISFIDKIKELLKQNEGHVIFDEPGGVFLQYDFSDGFDGGYCGEEYAVHTNEIYLKDECIYAKCGKHNAECEEDILYFDEVYPVSSKDLKKIEHEIYAAVAMNGNTPTELVTELLQDEKTRRIVAYTPSAPLELLLMLSKDSSFDVRWRVDENQQFLNFLSNINDSLEEADHSIKRILSYDVENGQCLLRYDDHEKTVRKVDFDLEKNTMNIYSTKNENEVVGIFDLNTKKMTDLRSSVRKVARPDF